MARRLRHLAFVAAILASGCNSLFGISQGTPRPICTNTNPLESLIDDMEDGDSSICALDGRNGGWYRLGDGTSSDLTPALPFEPKRIPGGRGTSQYAAHFGGSGFTDWGALMGFNLKQQGRVGRIPDDASSAGGIKFWLKSNAPVTVEFLLPETTSPKDGGTCSDTATAGNCNNPFSFKISAASNDWTEFEVPFAALSQQPGGSATWNPRFLLGIQFAVGRGAAFDVWVDDIRFYFCSTSDCHLTCTDPAFPVSCPADARDPAACLPPGTDCAAVATWCDDPSLVDDMEDGNSAICASGGRHGRWSASGDDTPGATLTPNPDADFTQTAIPGGRGASHYAARLTGSGFTASGAAMGLTLNDQPPGTLAYDASSAGGIKFWMKNNEAVAVILPTVETAPPDRSGQCADGPGEHNCNNFFSFAITAPSNDWVEYQLPFVAFGQTDGSAAWNRAHLLNIVFAARRDTTFDVWVDDIQLYDCAASGCLPTCTDPAFPVQCAANAQAPAGCRPPGTDCATFVLGCAASNTTRAPADGLIAMFSGANGGSDIAGDVVALGDPAPTYTTDGTLHITVDSPSTPVSQTLEVVDRFQDCVDATAFTGVQFSISGSLSGCALRYFTEDSAHLYDDGDPMSHAHHGIAGPGFLAPFITLTPGQVTSAPQTLMMPFAAASGVFSPRPFEPGKVTGFGLAFVVDPATASGAPSCVADLTIDDVRFY